MDPFEKAELGGTGVMVTRLGMGLTEIGEDTTADVAWRLGVRFFDTEPDSERRAGLLLRRRDRSRFTLSARTGLDFSAEGVRESHEESLRRLGMDRVDVLHLRDPGDHFTEAATQALPALAAMRKDGTIRAVSAGMSQSAMLTAFARTGLLDCVLLAGRYSLLDQSGLAELLPECRRRNIAVIAGGVYHAGVLADPFRPATPGHHPAAPEAVARAQAMARLCDRHGVPLRAAALQFPLAHPAVTSVLVGMRSPEEAADAAAMARVRIPDGLWRDLSDAWLLDREIPVPAL
ncbi:oxidoreductase [Actinoplanes sp. OR16]|uniref:aldo/keto reductase n=1 Tax=Actinoplanes sp. OR16 TaxID=946334 RepID=UPI000F6E7515|nr:aldo/keto reductase [Actinoplanes sp. OR16]BBH67512.1 oxidoreductase [Actinoplanes sp. OR16]